MTTRAGPTVRCLEVEGPRVGAPPFDAHLQFEDGCAVVAVRGELDFATAPDLAERLAEAVAADPKSVVVDLTETSFLDCFAIHAIVRAREDLGAESELIIRRARPFMVKVLRILEIDRNCVIEE